MTNSTSSQNGGENSGYHLEHSGRAETNAPVLRVAFYFSNVAQNYYDGICGTCGWYVATVGGCDVADADLWLGLIWRQEQRKAPPLPHCHRMVCITSAVAARRALFSHLPRTSCRSTPFSA